MNYVNKLPGFALSALLVAGVAGPIGCSKLPGTAEQQGAVGGGVAGAGAGAALAEDNRLLGAAIGGVLGAGGGYLIGREIDKRDEGEAREAAEQARRQPATVEQARTADSADLDDNGFVTLDEVVALEEAGLSDRQIVDRLEATDQVFALSQEQEQILLDEGVSRDVIRAMRTLNQDRESLGQQRISQPVN